MKGFELSTEGMRILLLIWLFLVMVLLLFLVIGQVVRKDNSPGHKCDTVFFSLLFMMSVFWRTQNQRITDGYADAVSWEPAAWFIAAVGSIYALLRLIWLKRHRCEILSRDTIRESLDNLSMGVAFFDKTGFPVLINRRMHVLGREMSGTEIQSLDELEEGLLHPVSTVRVVSRDPAVFEFPSGSVWKYSRETVKTGSRESFTQILAVDVTELSASQKRLEQENEQLRKAGGLMRMLSAKMVSITREEEVLAMKAHLHDELGYNVLATHRALKCESLPENVGELMKHWRKTLRLLGARSEKKEKSYDEGCNVPSVMEERIAIIRERAENLGLTLQCEGTLPEKRKIRKLLWAALLECMTNSVRHGNATELKMQLSQESGWYQAVFRNNGRIPKKEIAEGGGLSGLRTRIQQEGGTMEIQVLSDFALIIRIPEEDGV